MPTSTFFRLPSEKRQRLLDAAWNEFTRVNFSDVSINKIIQTAQIPRGSFYQYFENKDDLFLHLIELFCGTCTSFLSDTLTECGGDIFEMSLRAYDTFISAYDSAVPYLSAGFEMFRRNHGINLQQFLDRIFGPPASGRALMPLIDRSAFRQKDNGFTDNVVFLVFSSLAFAVMAALRDSSKTRSAREALTSQLDIIRCGAIPAPDKGEKQ